jgi:hypothetical protein
MQASQNWRTLSISLGMILVLLLAACGASGSHGAHNGSSSTGSASAHNPPDGTLFLVSSGSSTTGGSSATTLTAINPATGANQWQANINSNVDNQMSVTQGVIIVPLTSSQATFAQLAGYDAGTGKQLWQTPALPAQTFIERLVSGTGVVAYVEGTPRNLNLAVLDAKTGKQLWQAAIPTFPAKVPVPPPPGFPRPTYTANITSLLAADGLVLMGFTAGVVSGQQGNNILPFQSGIIAYNAQTGAKVWSASFNTTGREPQDMVANSNEVFFTLSQPFSAQGTPTPSAISDAAINLATGKVQWTVQQPWVIATATDSALFALVAGSSTNQTQTPTHLVAVDPASGTARWTSATFQYYGSVSPGIAFSVRVVGDTVVLPEVNQGSTDIFDATLLAGYDINSGSQLWTIHHVGNIFITGNGSVFAGAVQLQGTLVPGQPPTSANFSVKIEAFDAQSGALQWSVPYKGPLVGTFFFLYSVTGSTS